jgi:hypothetical protein
VALLDDFLVVFVAGPALGSELVVYFFQDRSNYLLVFFAELLELRNLLLVRRLDIDRIDDFLLVCRYRFQALR